jgi:hypothetical protein
MRKMPKALIGFLFLCLSITAQAKLGETAAQLTKRFGKNYAVLNERGEVVGFRVRSEKVNVDVVIKNGVSVVETYYSNHPLTATGEPPNDIVHATLDANVPRTRWVEVDAAPFGADYALESSDHEYIALLRYKGPQHENAFWTMTVARRPSLASALSAEDILGPPPATDSKPGAFDEPATSKSGMPSLPWETQSNKVLTVFVNHVSDVEALYNRPMTQHDGEWVYAVDRVARSAADYAIGVDLLSRLHWQPQDKTAIKAYLGYVRQMLTSDIATLDGAVNNSQLAVIREEGRSLRNDIRAFDDFIASMVATVSALPAATPPEHTDSGRKQDSF